MYYSVVAASTVGLVSWTEENRLTQCFLTLLKHSTKFPTYMFSKSWICTALKVNVFNIEAAACFGRWKNV